MTDQQSILIVNGDDAGADQQGDQALLTLARLGVMRAVSLLANGSNVKSFIVPGQDLGLSLGLHFNLSDGRPSGGPYKTLTDENGFFFSPKQFVWEKAAAGHFDPDEIAAEAVAQWQALESMGVAASHIDGHNHIHIFECTFYGLLKAFGDKKIFFRLPEEPECPVEYLPGLPNAKLGATFIREHAHKNWRFANRFVGFLFSTLPTVEGVAHLAQAVPGVTEWMVHPNQRPGSTFTTDEKRSLERDFLMSKRLKNCLQQWGYECGDFNG